MMWFNRLLLRLALRWLPPSVVLDLPRDRVELALDRGRRAEALLADEVLIAAFQEIEGGLTSQWRDTPTSAKEARESLFYQVAATQSVLAQLQAWAEDARFVAAQIERRR